MRVRCGASSLPLAQNGRSPVLAVQLPDHLCRSYRRASRGRGRIVNAGAQRRYPVSQTRGAYRGRPKPAGTGQEEAGREEAPRATAAGPEAGRRTAKRQARPEQRSPGRPAALTLRLDTARAAFLRGCRSFLTRRLHTNPPAPPSVPRALATLPSAAWRSLEGIVSSLYRSDRSSAWIKLKCAAWREANRDRHVLFERPK